MIPSGYMAKFVEKDTTWIKNKEVEEILSVSGCISKDFTDWIDYWKHNDFWFFDNVEKISTLAESLGLDVSEVRWFYYETYELEFFEKDNVWKEIDEFKGVKSNVEAPEKFDLKGYDIVTHSCRSSAECSPLSCNGLAKTIPVNQHCLID